MGLVEPTTLRIENYLPRNGNGAIEVEFQRRKIEELVCKQGVFSNNGCGAEVFIQLFQRIPRSPWTMGSCTYCEVEDSRHVIEINVGLIANEAGKILGVNRGNYVQKVDVLLNRVLTHEVAHAAQDPRLGTSSFDQNIVEMTSLGVKLVNPLVNLVNQGRSSDCLDSKKIVENFVNGRLGRKIAWGLYKQHPKEVEARRAEDPRPLYLNVTHIDADILRMFPR